MQMGFAFRKNVVVIITTIIIITITIIIIIKQMRNLSHALPFFQLTFLQNLPVLFTLLSSGSYLLYFVQILHFLGGKVGSVHILFCPFRFCLHLDGRVTMICWWIKSESVLGGSGDCTTVLGPASERLGLPVAEVGRP